MKLKKIAYSIASIFLILLFVYLVQPLEGYPNQPEGSLQSNEPADVESELRRAYFTDFQREEVVSNYSEQFSPILRQRLNHPPEDAQKIIRDQTRSSYLEEINQPFRFSLYVNGFIPKEAKDNILIEGRNYYQKVTVRYVPTSLIIRMLFFLSTAIFTYLIIFSTKWLKRK